MAIRKAVIPAAGFGTRMLPAAKAVPKEMLPVLDRPTIPYRLTFSAGTFSRPITGVRNCS
jgi:UTP--glucose-1-phosphate uridylyltransferase